MNNINNSNKSSRAVACITGASSGIGREMAKLLSKKGYDLILVSRNTKEMLLLSQQLSTRCEIITCDLSDENACIKLGRTLAKKNIYIFINNAGFGDLGSFDKTSLNKELSMINVNIKAKPMRNGSYMIVEKYREGRMMARSVWWDKDTNTEKGTLLVKELMEGKVFDYPKTVEMLMKTIEMGTDSDEGAYVLDFFSGSGTTAHAVMQLNAKDGGNRKFIMVQLPERTDEKSEAYKAGYKNICEIGKERIRRAGRKIKEDSPLTTQDLDIGFRVLKCDTSNMKEVYYNPAEYEASLFPRLEDNIKEDRTPEDLLFQVMLDLGVLLSSKIEETTIAGKKVFNVEDNYLIACFDSNVTEETIKAIAKQKPYYFVMRDSSMANDSVATNFDQIFATYSPDTVRKVL